MNNIRPKKGYGYIYKYTSPSGKSYIGQTILSLSERAGHNGKKYKGCPLFYQAIKKYGFKNFEVSILAEIKKEQLNDAEKKYITLFNTEKPNGYNWLAGGKTRISTKESVVSLKEKEVNMFDLNGKYIMFFSSLARAANYVGGERSPIKKVCRGELKSAYGYKWSCIEILKEKKYNNTAKRIEKLDKDTNKVIEVYSSISAAAKSLEKSTSLIRRVLDKDRTAYGFKWRTAQGSTTKRA